MQSVCLHVIKAFLLQKLPGSIHFFCFPCDLKQEYLFGPGGQDIGVAVNIKQNNGLTGSGFSPRFDLSQATGLSYPGRLLDKLQVGFSSLTHFLIFSSLLWQIFL